MTKLLVISDVHGELHLIDEIIDNNKDVDYKIYLGDFQTSIEKQKHYSDMFDYVVTGNCDYTGISPVSEYITIDGVNLLITHGHYFGSMFVKIDFDTLFRTAKENNVDVILHGHDHIAIHEERKGIHRFNPGSTTFPRGNRIPTYGIVEINSKTDIKFTHTKV